MKILVVEDDAFTNRMLEKYLVDLDFEVLTASNGLQGWEIFCQEEVHFVITDWMMPEMNGPELIKKIRESDEKAYCYVILLTAKNDQEEIVEGISSGADDYVIKPFHKEELAVRVRAGQRVAELQEEVLKTNEQLKAELEERIMMTEVMHENEQQFRALVESIPGAVYRFRIDSEWTVEFMSDAIEDITSYPSSKFRWNSAQTYRDIIHPEDRPATETAVREGMGPMKSFDIEYRIIDANGKMRWFHETGQAIYNAEGEHLWVDGTIFDISEEKLAADELQKANRELQRLVSVDGLTQIANRRYFDDCLEKEWKRMIREQSIISLILCDIDFFKLYNDNYGHQEGDKCLKAVAQAINSAIKRPADIVARYGGEEFVVILPNTESEGAFFVAERIRQEILKLKIPHVHSEADQYITLSLGVSTAAMNQGIPPEALIESADRALYEAKEQGRNRAILQKIDELCMTKESSTFFGPTVTALRVQSSKVFLNDSVLT